jgi:hypothetical protein
MIKKAEHKKFPRIEAKALKVKEHSQSPTTHICMFFQNIWEKTESENF